MDIQKNALATALTAALGLGAATADAETVTASWTGLFSMLNPSGNPMLNTSYPYYNDPTWGYGMRTPISGTLTMDTSTGAGTATINPFDFMDNYPWFTVHDMTLQAIGDGLGGGGTLVAGGLLFDWGGNNNINVGIILDAAGFFGAWPWPYSGTTISGVGALPASNGMSSGTLPIGPAPLATTTWNTDFNVNPGCALTATCLTSNDTIGGDPMDNGPFPGFSANFDITSIHVDPLIIPSVPVPAAAWLLGSGLLGLVSVARRRKQS